MEQQNQEQPNQIDTGGLSKKERRMLRREERKQEQGKAQKTKKIKKILWWAGGVAILAGLAALAFYSANQIAEPLGEDFSQAIEDQGNQHIPEGQKVPEYNSNPPTSGPHWPNPLRDGIYDTEKPNEAAVHSLEHGRIWITYRPGIQEKAVEKLEELAGSESRVILSPREANDTDIALVAWTRLDKFDLSEGDSFDEKRIKDFIVRYRDKGPEFVPQNTGKTYE